MNRVLKYFIVVLVFGLFLTGCSKKEDKKPAKKPENPGVPDVALVNDYNIDLIKLTKRDKNYLISPYSIEIALNMLKEGAKGETKAQIEEVLKNRKVNDVSIKNRVKIANALFIKDSYKKKIKTSFSKKLVDNYMAEVLYDSFKTPDVINDWVNEKTDGMIKEIMDYIDPDFVLGLANALAIDVEWESPFECNATTDNEFTKADGSIMDVEMMHNSYDYSGVYYLKTKDATGIILPYQDYNKKTGKVDYENGSSLEFVGILPEDDVDSYISSLTSEKLNKLFDSAKSSSSSYEINLSLPRFKYAYSVPNFIDILKALGIKDAFSFDDADFTGIMKKEDMKENLYVSQAIHKTYIDLNEKGTKAAAVTFFGFKDTAMPFEEEKETVYVKFNKPFVYMIRDTKTKEILFFGAVYEPNEWKGSTCSES